MVRKELPQVNEKPPGSQYLAAAKANEEKDLDLDTNRKMNFEIEHGPNGPEAEKKDSEAEEKEDGDDEETSIAVSEDVGMYFICILRQIGRKELKYDFRFFQLVIILLGTFILQVCMTYLLADFYDLDSSGISDVKGSDAAKGFTTDCWKSYINDWGLCVGSDFINGNQEQPGFDQAAMYAAFTDEQKALCFKKGAQDILLAFRQACDMETKEALADQLGFLRWLLWIFTPFLAMNDLTSLAESLFIWTKMSRKELRNVPIIFHLLFFAYSLCRVIIIYFTTCMLIICVVDENFFRDIADLILNFTALIIILDFDNLLMDSFFFKRYQQYAETDAELFDLSYPKREAATIATLAQFIPAPNNFSMQLKDLKSEDPKDKIIFVKSFGYTILSCINWVAIVVYAAVLVNYNNGNSPFKFAPLVYDLDYHFGRYFLDSMGSWYNEEWYEDVNKPVEELTGVGLEFYNFNKCISDNRECFDKDQMACAPPGYAKWEAKNPGKNTAKIVVEEEEEGGERRLELICGVKKDEEVQPDRR